MENMKTHRYCKHIKARNSKGFVVQGISFFGLYDAEELERRWE